MLKQGILTQAQVNQVKLAMAQTGKSFKQLVREKGLINEKQMAMAEAVVLDIPFMEAARVGASPDVLNLVPQSLSERFNLFPISIDRKKRELTVLMADPTDIEAIDFLRKRYGVAVKAYLGIGSDIKKLIDERYSQGLSGDVSSALRRRVLEDKTKRPEVMVSPEDARLIRQPAVIKIVNQILEHAMKLRASDVHIEPQESRTRVRYRIDGILQEKLQLPREMQAPVVSRIKILSGMKIDEKRLPQDGRFTFTADGQEVDLRVSSLPTVHGEKIVMRLLKKTGKVPTLAELGLRGRALKTLKEIILVPHGIVLVTGPTGSGKTTTLYSVLTSINSTAVNIITLEDPVEYEMAGINQVQVNPQAGLTFASGLRSFLRQDPNIIMVGEIRDSETTELAIQAALTGHLVFSTVHTNSASGAVPRLLDLGAEPFLLVSTLTAIVGQRVVRKICEACKESYVPTPVVIEDIKNVLGKLFDAWKQSNKNLVDLAEKQGAEIVLYRGKGGNCTKCGGSGYMGMVGIFEVLRVSDQISKLVAERATAQAIEDRAVQEGMILMKQDGYLKALNGISTLEEVLRVAEVAEGKQAKKPN